jgi:multidrug resistance efflux pump
MPNVIVNPVQQINVRVNQGNQQTVHSTATFVGSDSNAAQAANTALQLAQAAYNSANAGISLANSAYSTANTKVSKAGDTMTGNLIITEPAVIQAKIDGGTFS